MAGEMQPGMGADAATQDDAPTEATGGFTVCIRVAEGGELSVGVQKPVQPTADGAGEYMTDPDYRPAADRKEALTLALELLKNGGRVPQDEADQQFHEGFTARGSIS